MQSIHTSIDANLVPIIFAYGLTFFAAGLAIALQQRQMSNFRLAHNLWMLGAFGIIHGAAEWGDIFIPIQSSYLSDFWIARLMDIQQIAWAVSFVFLLEFATVMIVPRLPFIPSVKWFIRWFTLLWSFAVVVTAMFFLPHAYGQSWIRYMLGFPAALLTAVAFLAERRTFSTYRASSRLNLTLTAAAFGAYAILGGLTTPEHALPGLAWMDYENVYSFTGMPIFFWRMLVGLCFTLLTIRTLQMFDNEFRNRLEAAEKEQTLAIDRQRIARDLHDGVVQSIYAAGLQLEVVARSVAPDSGNMTGSLRRVIDQLNGVITDIRRYIYNLGVARTDEASFDQYIKKLADEISAAGSIAVRISIEGARIELTPAQKQNIALITQECLSNTIKHAKASSADIKFNYTPEALFFSVEDNGAGFSTPGPETAQNGGWGLRGMKERAEAIDADLVISGNSRDGGTMVSMRIPYQPIKSL